MRKLQLMIRLMKIGGGRCSELGTPSMGYNGQNHISRCGHSMIGKPQTNFHQERSSGSWSWSAHSLSLISTLRSECPRYKAHYCQKQKFGKWLERRSQSDHVVQVTQHRRIEFWWEPAQPQRCQWPEPVRPIQLSWSERICHGPKVVGSQLTEACRGTGMCLS